MAIRLEQELVQLQEDELRHRYPGRLIHAFFQVIHERKKNEHFVLTLHLSEGVLSCFDVKRESQ